jgi:hypothetical protein
LRDGDSKEVSPGEGGRTQRLSRTTAHLYRICARQIDAIKDLTTSNLTVAIDRLKRWSRPGLLCIRDAARHVAVGGVGINLAIGMRLRRQISWRQPNNGAPLAGVQRVQRRRGFPTKVTQWVQVQINAAS